MAKNVSELTSGDFEKFIKSNDLVFIDFFAEWCMPCVMMSPIVDEVAEELKGKIKIGKVNVGEEKQLAKKYDVSSIPHFILFEKGKIKDKFVGSMTKEEMTTKLQKFL